VKLRVLLVLLKQLGRMTDGSKAHEGMGTGVHGSTNAPMRMRLLEHGSKGSIAVK
jgi:hypothetical protein